MFQEIMGVALGNGLWAALFCLLFLHQLKDSRAREKKYAETIDALTESLSGVRDIKRDCTEIAGVLAGVRNGCEVILADSARIKSDSVRIKLDTAAIKSESARIKSDTAAIKSDSASIKSDSAKIKADTAIIKADCAFVKSAACGKIGKECDSEL